MLFPILFAKLFLYSCISCAKQPENSFNFLDVAGNPSLISMRSLTPNPSTHYYNITGKKDENVSVHSYSFDGHYSTAYKIQTPAVANQANSNSGGSGACCNMSIKGFIDILINFLEEKSTLCKELIPLYEIGDEIKKGFAHLCDESIEVKSACDEVTKLGSMAIGSIYIEEDKEKDVDHCDLTAFFNPNSSEHVRVPIELNIKCWRKDSGSEFICVNQLHDKDQCRINKQIAASNEGNSSNSCNQADASKKSYIEWLVTNSDSNPISFYTEIPTPKREIPFKALPSNPIKTPFTPVKPEGGEEGKEGGISEGKNDPKSRKKISNTVEKGCPKPLKTVGSLGPSGNKVEKSVTTESIQTAKSESSGEEEDSTTNASSNTTNQDESSNTATIGSRKERSESEHTSSKSNQNWDLSKLFPPIIVTRRRGSTTQKKHHTLANQRNILVSKVLDPS